MTKLQMAGYTATVWHAGRQVHMSVEGPDGRVTGTTWPAGQPALATARTTSFLIEKGWQIV